MCRHMFRVTERMHLKIYGSAIKSSLTGWSLFLMIKFEEIAVLFFLLCVCVFQGSGEHLL